jgi:hypothetical protein
MHTALRISRTAGAFGMLLLALNVLAQEPTMLAHGVEVVVPNGWRLAESIEFEASQKSQRYASPELMKRVQDATKPETMIALAKYPADYVGFNPSILVTASPIPEELKSTSPDKLLTAMLPYITHGFFNVRVEEWVASLKIDGNQAARVTTSYEIHANTGRITPVQATAVVVIKGTTFFLIGTSAPATGEDDARTAFEKFLRSIRFKRAG